MQTYFSQRGHSRATFPTRPHAAISYAPAGRLFDLSRAATPPFARMVQIGFTPPRPDGQNRETYSTGLVEFSSGYRVPVVTTRNRRGFLLLELPRDAPLNAADAAAAALAVVGGHVRENAQQSRRGGGRN